MIDSELKLAQASMPNKQKLAAAMGMSPASFMGNISNRASDGFVMCLT